MKTSGQLSHSKLFGRRSYSPLYAVLRVINQAFERKSDKTLSYKSSQQPSTLRHHNQPQNFFTFRKWHKSAD